jgi:glutamyl-tRNA reductase
VGAPVVLTSDQFSDEVVPTIKSLREKLESIRRGEVARTLASLRDASPETRATVEALSSALVNKILHTPAVKLRESSRNGHGRRWALLVSEIFGLDRRAQPAANGPACERG